MPKIRRAPRNRFIAICQNPNCEKPKGEFYAFRTTAKYCGDTCRAMVRDKKKRSFRSDAIQIQGRVCRACGREDAHYFFVWPHPLHPEDPAEAIIVCGVHHSRIAQPEAARMRRIRWLESKNLPVPEDLL